MPPSDVLATLILFLGVRLPEETLYFFLFGPSPVSEPEDQPSQPITTYGPE